jgi:DNA-binding Lrp family transcriptional regulator
MTISSLDHRLLNDFQRDFPLVPHPFASLAARLGVSEEQVMTALEQLQAAGKISRIGPVFTPHRIGVSTLAAMAVPPARLQEVAERVNGYREVNHNYEREHHFNLWFVVTAADQDRLERILADIEAHSGIEVMSLPLLDDYHIDLGFPLEPA